MKCNEARRMVVPFVKKELSERDMERFLAHVESCPDCMDELDFYFMVYNALDAMDSGEQHEYDFKKKLEEEMRASRHAIWKRKAVTASRFVLLFFAEVLLFLCLFVGVRMKQGAVGDSIFERALLRMHIEQMNSAEDTLSETETAGTEIMQTEETAAISETADTDMSGAVSSDSKTEITAENAGSETDVTGGEEDAGE
ncbi:MAG: zf-HC2 domain-containing protein [Lachnospiraceae bacterium]|nr:zf-HC2 domain-containing protein [Lachnospiraceae bacterium]